MKDDQILELRRKASLDAIRELKDEYKENLEILSRLEKFEAYEKSHTPKQSG